MPSFARRASIHSGQHPRLVAAALALLAQVVGERQQLGQQPVGQLLGTIERGDHRELVDGRVVFLGALRPLGLAQHVVHEPLTDRGALRVVGVEAAIGALDAREALRVQFSGQRHAGRLHRLVTSSTADARGGRGEQRQRQRRADSPTHRVCGAPRTVDASAHRS